MPTLRELFGAGRWPMLFVVVSLLALTILPFVQSRRIAALDDEITDVLQPARRLGTELQQLAALQMAHLQSYLLSGDEAQPGLHRELVADERRVRNELQTLVERADLAIKEPLARLTSASLQWHLGHEAALAPEGGREEYLAVWAREQPRYSAVLSAARDLERSISLALESGRRRMVRARSVQTWLTAGLSLLALLATATVFGIGARLRALVTETEERRVTALQARREMEAVLEASGDGVVSVDLDGRCTSLNSTGTDLLGYPEIDAQGLSLHALLHGKAPPAESHEESECPALVALRSGTVERERDDTVWRRDGSSFPARWHLRPMLDGREIRGGVITITDMTDIRAAEEALRQAIRAREEVIGVVSHDLRSPLGTVMGAAELIDELDLPPEKVTTQVRAIRVASERMGRLIEDLLDVSRIEAGGLPVRKARVEPGPLLDDVVEQFAPQAVEAEVTLSASTDDSVPAVLGDEGRLGQVFSNLVSNALRFTPAGGSVELEARALGAEVEFIVRDTGAGIDPEHRDRLFDRFWQGSRDDREGAGLGLAIVAGIVEAHEGTVTVESEPGSGTTFRVTLDRFEERSAGRSRSGASSATPRAPRPHPS